MSAGDTWALNMNDRNSFQYIIIYFIIMVTSLIIQVFPSYGLCKDSIYNQESNLASIHDNQIHLCRITYCSNGINCVYTGRANSNI